MGIHNQALELALGQPKSNDMGDIQALKQFNHLMPREIWRWRDELIQKHQPIAKHVISAYIRTARQHGYATANSQLRELDGRLITPMLSELRTRVVNGQADISDSEICEQAKANAETCNEVFEIATHWGFYEGVEAVEKLLRTLGFELPNQPKKRDTEKGRTALAGAIVRVSDERWWRMQLRRNHSRTVEQELRKLGAVKRGPEVYLSDWAYRRWQRQNKRNRATLERLEVVNELDERCCLADAVDSSVSNPVNRRNELMMRMSGYEEIADSMNYTALFLTLTAPSKYHERLLTGVKNTQSINATPRESMDYLSSVWSRIRAKWHRNNIRPFGFRVAEPHHDGTPHWHMLLFFCKSQSDLAWSIFREEALAEDGNENGAEKHRATCVHIDKDKGSAAGYIAKYIAKNVDGENVGADDEAGQPAINTASRTRAWASLWGIRQFQQIGSVSVTVWRELRYRTKPLEEWECSEAEALRAAADDGDWVLFVELMGGATVKRNDQTLRPQPVLIDTSTSRYGEEVHRILGVVMRATGRFIKTRLHTWRIRTKSETEQSEALEVAAQPPPLDLCQ